MKSILLSVYALSIILPIAFCGKAVLTGGGVATTNAEIYDAFIDLATMNGESYIGVVTAGISLSVAESTANTIMRRLQRTYGATRVEWLPFHQQNGSTCTSTTLANRIKSMTGIYFNGGDVEPYLDCFFRNGQPSPALTVMRTQYKSNKLAVMGASAGTLIVPDTPVLKTRESYSTLRYGSSVTATAGFGLFEYGFIDVHFSPRGRQGRVMRLIEELQRESHVGYGVDEDTAMVIDGTKFSVVGTKGVYIFNAEDAINTSGKRFGVNSLKGNYLTKGDSYNFLTERVTHASWKQKITSSLQDNATSKMTYDIFKDGMFTTLTTRLFMTRLSTSTYGYTAEIDPRFRLNFRKTSESAGYIGKLNGKQYISYENLFIDIYCSSGC